MTDTLDGLTALHRLHQWADRCARLSGGGGGLRRLDSALATLVHEADPASGPPLWVAAACVSALEGRGHTALPLALLADASLAWLALPDAVLPQVQALWSQLPRTEADWQAVLQASPAVAVWRRREEAPTGIPAPLVLVPADPHGPALLGLHRHARQEAEVARQLLQRAARVQPVDAVRAAAALRLLFPQATVDAAEPDWQAVACEAALRAGLTVITGGPGTGKTYTAARLLALLAATHPDPATLRVALAAPTGKAAARLRQSIAEGLADLARDGGLPADFLAHGQTVAQWAERIAPARTLHALLGARPDTRRLRHDAAHPLDVDVLVVDEASMVHLDLMAALLQALPAHARLVLLGDKDQLASVEAGSVLGDLCQGLDTGANPHSPSGHRALDASPLARQTVMLRRSRRFAGGIGQLALAVNSGELAPVQAVWAADHADLARWSAATAADRPGLLRRLDELAVQHWGGGYLALLRQGPPRTPSAPPMADDGWADWARQVLKAWEGFRVLCAVHGGDFGTQGLNRRLQHALALAGCLHPGGEWYAGRPVMVTRNDPSLGLSNGDVGVVLPVGSRLKACFLEGDAVRALPVGRLAHVETAFALTVHKSQGSEFGHVALVLPPHGGAGESGGGGALGRELVYTGITRARSRFSLFEGSAGGLASAVGQPTRRFSGLGARLAQ